MKKKIKWGLVLCSVLIPVCLSACKQGTVEKQGSSNKEVQKKIDRKNIHFDKTGPAATFDWDAKNSSRYITFEKLPQYMRPDDSDGISKYGKQPNEVSLSEEGRVQKALQVVEGVYVDQSGIDTVIKANGAKDQEDMYTRLWNDYIIPKIEKNSSTFDPNTYVEYLGEKYPLKIYGPMYLKLMTNALRFEKKYELKGYAVKGNKVFLNIQVPKYFPEPLPRWDKYSGKPNESDSDQMFYDWLDELHQRYAEKETNRDDHISYIMLSTVLKQLVNKDFDATSSSGYTDGEIYTTEFTVEMEVTDQGDVRIDLKNLAILLQIPRQMKGENQYGKEDENNIFWTIPSGNNNDGQKIKEKLKNFNPKDPVKSYAIGEPVLFANGLEVTLNRVTDDPNLDVQDDQDRIDTRKKQHRLIVEFTLSNPTPLRIENTPDYTNVDLYDGHGKSAYMLNNTLNYKQPTVLEAGESGIYKINYLTDGDGPFTVVYGDAKWVVQK
ncbi:hypothetical protein [Streptococcus parasanguinis]|uniref:hypothetical protein n=1 Tax=Streptococcus parasanguinis TaxID=1318 RepID=UPI000A5B4829|nr:hypothetical protein [Streptococcus parasanguinis]